MCGGRVNEEINGIVYESVLLAHGQCSAVPYNSNKCNVFVAHRLIDCNMSVPMVHEGGGPLHLHWPPLAREWGTSTFFIAGWRVLSNGEYPQPGMVAICPSMGDVWHVGILDFDGAVISAQDEYVTRLAHISRWNGAIFRTRTESVMQ